MSVHISRTQPANSAAVKAGSAANSVFVAPASLLGGLGMSGGFTSSNQTITAGGTLTIAHGLTRRPVLVEVELECTTAEAGYSIGDVLMYSFGQGNQASLGCSIVVDSTNLNIRYGSTAGVFLVLNKGTGTQTIITAANWVARFRAFA